MSSPTSFSMSSLGASGAYSVERERGRAAGFTAGYAAGAREADREAEVAREAAACDFADAAGAQLVEHQRALTALAAAAKAANQRTEPVVADAEAALFTAAVSLAEAVLERELADADDSAKAAVFRALHAPGDMPLVRVRLNPDDLVAITRLGVPEGVTFVADMTLGPGDAISEHPAGMFDARIGSALDRARDALRDVTG